MYQLASIKHRSGQINYIKYVTEDGNIFSIPINPDNTDYQAFLRWCEEGNEPLPAEETK